MTILKKILNVTFITVTLFSLNACKFEETERDILILESRYWYFLEYSNFLETKISYILRNNEIKNTTTVRDFTKNDNYQSLSLLKEIDSFNESLTKINKYCKTSSENKSSLFVKDSTYILEIQDLLQQVKESCKGVEEHLDDYHMKDKDKLLEKISNDY